MDVIDLTVKQAMASLNYATHSKQLQVEEWYKNDYPATQDDVVRIHERFAHIYFNANVRAAMAWQEDSESEYDHLKDKSVNCNGLRSLCHDYWITPEL